MNRIRSVAAEIQIDAPVERVWHVWSTFGNVADYVAGVPKSHLLGDHAAGVGMQRRCDISAKQQVDERIVAWVPGESYTMEVVRAVGLPIATMRGTFTVEPSEGGTRARATMEYAMKGVLNWLPLGRVMKGVARDHLIGLRHHVETGAIVTPEVLKQIRPRYAGEVREVAPA